MKIAGEQSNIGTLQSCEPIDNHLKLDESPFAELLAVHVFIDIFDTDMKYNMQYNPTQTQNTLALWITLAENRQSEK